MNALLDTHTFIWWVTDAPQLSETAKATAQSKVTGMPILTIDRLIIQYDVEVIW